jgi:hypothetical protein
MKAGLFFQNIIMIISFDKGVTPTLDFKATFLRAGNYKMSDADNIRKNDIEPVSHNAITPIPQNAQSDAGKADEGGKETATLGRRALDKIRKENERRAQEEKRAAALRENLKRRKAAQKDD